MERRGGRKGFRERKHLLADFNVVVVECPTQSKKRETTEAPGDGNEN